MKKIVHIIPDLPPCGAEMVVLTYLRKFRDDSNYHVSAISLSCNKHRLYEQIVDDEGLDVTYLNQDICDNGLKSRIRQIKQLHKELCAKKPDIIHIHLSILWLVCFASIGTGVKKIFHTLHSNPEKTSYGYHVIIDRFCYRVFHVRPMALNCEMAFISNRLFRISNTLVLRNGIDLTQYSVQSKSELRHLFGFKDDCFILGHVGRFNVVKNHQKIVEVFSELKKINSKSKLLLVGDGEELNNVRNLVESLHLTKDVIFTGNRNDIPSMMALMDCFIFPSLYEGLGIVLIEAQAAGLKCVVSDTVPEETTVTEKVFRISLTADSQEWAKVINGDSYLLPSPVKQQISSYDINNIIKVLKNYYEHE